MISIMKHYFQANGKFLGLEKDLGWAAVLCPTAFAKRGGVGKATIPYEGEVLTYLERAGQYSRDVRGIKINWERMIGEQKTVHAAFPVVHLYCHDDDLYLDATGKRASAEYVVGSASDHVIRLEGYGHVYQHIKHKKLECVRIYSISTVEGNPDAYNGLDVCMIEHHTDGIKKYIVMSIKHNKAVEVKAPVCFNHAFIKEVLCLA